MGLNPRQRRNRARFLLEQARLRILTPPNNAVSRRGTHTPPPPPVSGDDTTRRTPPRELPTPCTHSLLGSTPKGRHPLPPPSSESPRKLLRIRRRIRARFCSARKTLFPVAPGSDREAVLSLGLKLPGGSRAQLTKHQDSSAPPVPDQESYHQTRQYMVAKFFRDSRTYFKDPRRNLDCPNISFYLQV